MIRDSRVRHGSGRREYHLLIGRQIHCVLVRHISPDQFFQQHEAFYRVWHFVNVVQTWEYAIEIPNEIGIEFAVVSKLVQFRSFHDAIVHSNVKLIAWL